MYLLTSKWLTVLNTDEYRNTWHFPQDNRTANTKKCMGITAFKWWIADNNAFSQRKQPQTLKNIVFHHVDRPMNVGRHVVFKRFLRIYCPRKWKKTHCIRRKTFVKTMFCYWKTTVNNKIQTVFPSFNRALNTRKTVVFVELTSRENCTIMERIPDSLTRQQRETLDFRFRKMSENAWIMPCFQIVTTCFLETPVNNRALKTRKTVAFVELTVNENCPIMERILQFAD